MWMRVHLFCSSSPSDDILQVDSLERKIDDMLGTLYKLSARRPAGHE